MTCREIEPYIVDLARSRLEDPAPGAEVARHVAGCRRCAALLESERTLSAALRGLADDRSLDVEDRSQGQGREAALLAAFDAAWASPRRRIGAPAWLFATAALLVIGAGATVIWVRVPPSTTPTEASSLTSPPATAALNTPPVSSADRLPPRRGGGVAKGAEMNRAERTKRAEPLKAEPMTPTTLPVEFVPWPGSAALPSFESGELMRLDLPASVLPSLGLPPPASQVAVVQADVLVGQDGFVRAVRLVPEP